MVYLDSYLFVTTTSILQVGVGVTSNFSACEYTSNKSSPNCAERLLSCVYVFIARQRYVYISILLTQVIIYLFLIERVHIVRGSTKTRKQDKLYWFNTLGLIPYCVIVILAIVFRYNALDDTGYCYVGLRRESSFPLLIYDLIINVSLSYIWLI